MAVVVSDISPNSLEVKDQVCRYYQIAGITVAVSSDVPITDMTFNEKFKHFQVATAGDDVAHLHHRFSLPARATAPDGVKVYEKQPWVIYRREDSWAYQGIMPNGDPRLFCYAEFNFDHTQGVIYHPDDALFLAGNGHALSKFPTDQIWLARLIAHRQACFLHSAGMVIQGQGVLFLGHSSAGKSTTVTMLHDQGELLCDDRIIVRHWPDGFRIHGTWSHGDVPDVSAASAPLRGLFFLEQSAQNQLLPIPDPNEVLHRLLFMVIKPVVSDEWWEKNLLLLGKLIHAVPAYRLQLDKSGKVVDLMQDFCAALV